ncbi:MAG TPA: peptidase S41, partial [Candidatus Tenderia electrophaga]|nr:peptidase S41 [Candidatus Tenderia electrophaga]
MKFSTRNIMLISLGTVLGLSLSIGQGVLAERDNAKLAPLPLDDLRTFTEVFGKIKSDYVETTEDS